MKIINSDKHRKTCKVLEEKMFLTNSYYQKIILNHQTLCTEVQALTFISFTGRDPITKEDLLMRKSDNHKEFQAALHTFSKKMHDNSDKGINVILAHLKGKIQVKKEESKKEDGLGFP